MRVAIAGEALIDFTSLGDLRFQGYCGGSPLNAAVAVARLGIPVGYVTQLSTDLFGVRLRRHVETNGVDARFVLSHPAPTTLAFVEREGEINRYQFLANGAADTLYAPDPLPTLPPETAFLHFGSVSLLSEPATHSFTRLVDLHRDRLTVVFDPNVRPTLIRDEDDYRRRCRDWIRACHLLKLSDDDAAYLAAGRDTEDTIGEWLDDGPRAVVLTSGSRGARLYRRERDAVVVSGFDVAVADTIGAGDTFTGAVSVGLLDRGVTDPQGLVDLSAPEWREVLRFAAAAAAINCTRPGADPPTRDEVSDFLARQSRQ
ncbi:MAG: carbohydrate kinase [Chloroflexota bacterium]|nr:carbohydrate kinase [Chloroflexota bacterium]